MWSAKNGPRAPSSKSIGHWHRTASGHSCDRHYHSALRKVSPCGISMHGQRRFRHEKQRGGDPDQSGPPAAVRAGPDDLLPHRPDLGGLGRADHHGRPDGHDRRRQPGRPSGPGGHSHGHDRGNHRRRDLGRHRRIAQGEAGRLGGHQYDHAQLCGDLSGSLSGGWAHSGGGRSLSAVRPAGGKRVASGHSPGGRGCIWA